MEGRDPGDRWVSEFFELQDAIHKMRSYLAKPFSNEYRWATCCRQVIRCDVRMVKRILMYDTSNDTMHYSLQCPACRQVNRTVIMIQYENRSKKRERDRESVILWGDYISDDEYGEFVRPVHRNFSICTDVRKWMVFRIVFDIVIDSMRRDRVRYVEYIKITEKSGTSGMNTQQYCMTCDRLIHFVDCQRSTRIRSCTRCGNTLFVRSTYQPNGTINQSSAREFSLHLGDYRPSGHFDF
jgi:ribosomal protein L37AE/L43A